MRHRLSECLCVLIIGLVVVKGVVEENITVTEQTNFTGCTDSSGQNVALNAETEIDCVMKKCVADQGNYSLQTIWGGCMVDGQCRDENSVWADFTGNVCTNRTCKRIDNGTDMYFIVENLSEGCRDGEFCKAVGTEIYGGCYTSSCVLDKQPKLKVIRADCPWQDSCMPPNSTWDHKCMTYKCDMKMENGHYRWNVIPVKYGCSDDKGNCYNVGQNVTDQCYDAVCRLNENKTVVYMDVIRGGCSWNNTCYDNNATWSDGCMTYKCDVTRAADEVNWKVKTVGMACRGFRDSCVAVGDTVVENCVTYKCNKYVDQLRLEPITVGCFWKNKCTSENSVWTDTDRCVDYKCHKSSGPSGTVMQVSVAGYGCVFNNTCMEVNVTWQDGCRTRKCEVKVTDTTIQRSIAPISAGCDDQGMCRKVGYKKMTDTCREYECVFNDTYKDAFFTLTRGACRSKSGGCKMVGTRWQEIQSGMCLEYECRKARLGYVSKMIQKKCFDANGKCQEIGATGFPADIDGILRTDCKCTDAGDSILIKCKAPPVK